MATLRHQASAMGTTLVSNNHEHALPPETVRNDDSNHWKSLFGFWEKLKAWGMEHSLEPTAASEEFRNHCDNCKIVLKDQVSCFCEKEGGGEALKRAVSTWA